MLNSSRPAARRVACTWLRSLSSKAAQGASEEASKDGSKIFLAVGGLALLGLGGSYVSQYGASPKSTAAKGAETTVSNW